MGGLRSILVRLAIPGLLLPAILACGRGEDPGPASDGLPPAAEAPVNPLAGGVAGPSNPLAAGAASPHGELAALHDAERARVRESLGADAGVRVARVAPGGALETAGLRGGDVLVALGGAPVRTPAEVLARLDAGGGDLEAAWLRPDDTGEWTIHRGTIRRAGGAGAAHPPAEPAPAAGVEPQTAAASAPPSLEGAVRAYFEMLDFSRSQAWGRRSETKEEVVRAALALLKSNLGEISAAERSAVFGLPEAREVLRRKWAAADEALREKQREHWRDQLVLPNPLLPFLGRSDQFRSGSGSIQIDYPAGWTRAQTEADGAQYLFLGPPVKVSWAQVANPATCPTSALFVIAPIDDDLRAVKSLVEGARLITRQYVLGAVPGFREVAAFRIGPGALVVLRGARPGESGDWFCWVGVMPFGRESFLVARFLAPVSRAEELLPAFSGMLGTLEANPPDEEWSLRVSLYASMAGNLVVSSGWPD